MANIFLFFKLQSLVCEGFTLVFLRRLLKLVKGMIVELKEGAEDLIVELGEEEVM